MLTKPQYPVAYAKLMAKGFRWQRLRESSGQTVIVWRQIDTQEIRITLSMDGRVQEFVPASNGELVIARPESKPDVNSAQDDDDHGVLWLSTKDDESLQVTAIMGVSREDSVERLEKVYGDN